MYLMILEEKLSLLMIAFMIFHLTHYHKNIVCLLAKISIANDICLNIERHARQIDFPRIR